MNSHKDTRKRNKSTRWDCDVSLIRGIPNTFPSFHNWSTKNQMFYTGSDERFNMCHTCNSWVAQVDIYNHPCWDYKNNDDILDMDMFPVGHIPNDKREHYIPESFEELDTDVHKSESLEELDTDVNKSESFEELDTDNTLCEEVVPKYVISTEENYDCNTCSICDNRLILIFDEELDEWIFTGCIENDNKVVHEECFLCAFK